MKAKAKATIAVGLTMAALAGLVLPVGAGAAKTYHQKPEVVTELHLRGTHGFRFSAFTFDDMKIVSASKNAGNSRTRASITSPEVMAPPSTTAPSR